MTTSTPSAHTNIAGPCRHKPIEQRCVNCILDESDFFAPMSVEAKLILQKGLHHKNFARHELLYREGGSNPFLYILVSGEVKVYKATADGRQQIHKIVSIPGDLVGCEDMFLDVASSTAEAIGDVALCGLKREYLRKVAQQHPEISDVMMQAMSRNLNAYIRHIANLGTKTALQRVASYLVFQHETHSRRGTPLEFLPESLTRVEMAEMLGITQRTLIRSLKELESGKVVKLTKDGYIIGSMDKLVQLAEEA